MQDRHHFNLGRVQNLTDGIFAVAMTLLVLDIRLGPGIDRDAIGNGLIALIPNLYSYVVSFFVLALFWWVYHRMTAYLVRADDGFVWWNVGFLFAVTLLPFSAHVLGTLYGTRVAAEIYCAHLTVLGLLQIVMWRYAQGHEMLADHVTPLQRRQLALRLASTTICYAIAMAIGYWLPYWFWVAFFLTFLIRPHAREPKAG